MAGEEPARPRVKHFACPNCGGNVQVSYPGASLSAACSSCGSVMDVTDSNYRIISAFQGSASLWTPLLEIGSRGNLEGKTWEVIGFMVRRDRIYYWDEYLLFNPYYGYRWLVQNDGQWTFVHTIKQKPRYQTARIGMNCILNGKRYVQFNRGNAEVSYVNGEFYWKVVIGSTVEYSEYLCVPEMLSSEKTDDEIVWSIATYISPFDVAKAFKQASKFPTPKGVGPTQPSSASNTWRAVRKQWGLFAFILTLLQFFFMANTENALVARENYNFAPNIKMTDLTTPKFKLSKDFANLKIEVTSRVDNSWLYLGGDLVNNANGATTPFESTVEFYHGYDSDGYWSEGGQTSNLLLHAIPGGEYYLNFDTESGDFKDSSMRDFTISIWRDVSTVDNYFWCLFFLSILPIIFWYRAFKFEEARWESSDYSGGEYRDRTFGDVGGGVLSDFRNDDMWGV